MLQVGADAPNGESAGTENINLPREMNAPRFSAASHHGASTESTDSLTRGDGCLIADCAVDGATSATSMVPIHKDTITSP